MSAAEPARRASGAAPAIAAALLAGFSCMVAELTAVRLLAPSFGDSAFVWTNVIGIILAALAVGAWIGGRLAAGGEPRRSTFRLLAGAAVLVAIAPLWARTLGQWLLPADLPLDAAMPAMVRGSFVATALLFGPAMALLGGVSPLLVTTLVQRGAEVGRAAGSVAAAGTIGSLGGTFAATHWLVPDFGCRAAMVVAGVLLAVAGLLVAPGRGGRAAGAAMATLAAATTLLHGPMLRPAPEGRQLLAERESRCQFLQVQREEGEPGPRTILVINEGLDSFHSLAVAGSSLTGGAYYDWHAVAPLLAGDGARPGNLRALSIGDAAGSLRTVYAGVHPGAVVDGVDIDEACIELGRQWFGQPKGSGGTFVLDGRVFLATASASWHVIHVDAYAHQVYVPAHLASREFFTLVRDRLEPGGVVACNIGALHTNDPVLRAIGATLGEVFGHALAFQVPSSRNFLVVARKGGPPEPAKLGTFTGDGDALSPTDRASWHDIVATAARPELWTRIDGGSGVLVDDRPSLDRLLLASYVDRRDPGSVIPCAGSTAVAGAELAAYGHARARRWDDVLAAVGDSSSPSASLREIAGDARWSLRQLASAAAEYAAALACEPDAPRAERLRQKLAGVRADLAPIEHADRVGRRNGWLEAAVAVAAVMLAMVAWRAR